jgi:hypothetical protein
MRFQRHHHPSCRRPIPRHVGIDHQVHLRPECLTDLVHHLQILLDVKAHAHLDRAVTLAHPFCRIACRFLGTEADSVERNPVTELPAK